MQTKKQSLYESFVNIAIGYIFAILSQMIIFPLFDIDVQLHENLQIGAYFTILSLVRSYMIRRMFNNRQPNEQ
ncbi:MAG: DUF7220 family protein [Candidatus Kariarchaeaceae archaeon]